MAKFYGKIGYIKSVEVEPGYWEEQAIEKNYYGDVIRNISDWRQSSEINDDISFNNTISIVADPYANENFQHIRYVIYMNTKWKVTSVECKYPRLILTIGGVYNAYKIGASEET